MAQLTLFEDDRPPQAARLGPRLRALAARRDLLRHQLVEVRGLAGSIYSPGDTPSGAGSRSGSSRPNAWPSTPRPSRPSAATSASTSSPAPTTGSSSSASVPATLQFAFKVPEEITVAAWPGHARYGARAGRANASFLDARLFERQFAGPLGPYQDRVATLIFEFGTIPQSVFATAAEFAGRLDAFLGGPAGRLSLRGRGPQPRIPRSRATSPCSARHGVAHVVQRLDADARPRRPGRDARGLHGRFHGRPRLLRPGRTYEQAVDPLLAVSALRRARPAHARGPRPDRRAVRARSGKPAYVFVNNRLEGHAPTTIEAVAEALESGP